MLETLTRKQTATEVLRIISKLPSRELVANSYVTFHLEGLKPGDCRFCVKGAVETFTGERQLVRNSDGVFYNSTFGNSETYRGFDHDVLNEVEDELFDTDASDYTPEGRRKLFRAAVRKCKSIIRER